MTKLQNEMYTSRQDVDYRRHKHEYYIQVKTATSMVHKTTSKPSHDMKFMFASFVMSYRSPKASGMALRHLDQIS